MIVVKDYESFNARRFGNPWVAILNKETIKLDFSKKVGGYTGSYGKGEAGQLYLLNPSEKDIYGYGQKDYRGNQTSLEYIQYIDGKLIPVEKSQLISAIDCF